MIHFDIEWNDLLAIGDELGASDKQVQLALWHALRRTASRLRQLSARGLRTELQLRKLGYLRSRLRSIQLKKGRIQGVQLWYGLNDVPVSWLKGKPTASATGAAFRGHDFPGAFIGKSHARGRTTVLKRKGAARLPVEEQLMPIKDQADVFVQDEIFVQLEDIFWPLFRRDLNARLRYQIGEA